MSVEMCLLRYHPPFSIQNNQRRKRVRVCEQENPRIDCQLNVKEAGGFVETNCSMISSGSLPKAVFLVAIFSIDDFLTATGYIWTALPVMLSCR